VAYLLPCQALFTDKGFILKIFQDVLSKKYGFNDNRIFAGHQYKILVPKGEEFIVLQLLNIIN
jgi:hypothetical protein